MTNAHDNVAAIAQHPTVQLHFNALTCWQFAKYYVAQQQKSETLLSLLDTIEHWRTTPAQELVKEMQS